MAEIHWVAGRSNVLAENRIMPGIRYRSGLDYHPPRVLILRPGLFRKSSFIDMSPAPMPSIR